MRSRLVLFLGMLTMAVGLLLGGPLGGVLAQDGEATPEAEPAGEVVVDGQRYAFDREITIDLGQLQEIADEGGNPVFVKGGPDPLGAVYRPDGEAVRRYLPQHLDAPETACPTEANPASSIEGNGAIYIPAGIDPDIAPEQLVQVGQTADGRTLYAPSTDQPFEQLYAGGAEEGLLRYLLVQESGVPVTFPEQMSFAGQQFQLAGSGATSPDGLQKVGCFGAFPALAASGETAGPFSAIHIQAGSQLVTYEALETPEPTNQPTEPPIIPSTPPPTVQPTQSPTEAPTAPPEPTIVPTEVPTTAPPEPTIVPTEAPTATPEPTTVPTEVPTTAPPEPTTVPTEEATAAPTATTAPTEAPPTAAPTEPPTSTETPEPTTLPTDAPDPTPTPESTQAPATATPTGTPPSRPTPTPQILQPPAVVPTLPPDAPPPAAATSPATGCTGNPGPIGDDGLPERLPEALQYGGTGYRFVETVPLEETGELTRIGCVGPFEALTSDSEGVLYLTLSNVADTAFRYEVTSSFSVSVEVTTDPRVLTLQGQDDQPDVRYRAADPLERSVYSSVTLVLYVADPEATEPERVLGHAVDHDVIGEYLPEGAGDAASDEVLARAESVGILPTLTLGTSDQTYVLVALWEPFGTTTNGWLTLYGPQGETAPEQLVGLDPRRLDLAVFNRID